MLDLDTIGECSSILLPVPIGVILDEFPTLGKLDSLMADVNLVHKRRISILIGAQTKGLGAVYARTCRSGGTAPHDSRTTSLVGSLTIKQGESGSFTRRISSRTASRPTV